MYTPMNTCMWVHVKARRGYPIARAIATDGCKPPYIGAGNQNF